MGMAIKPQTLRLLKVMDGYSLTTQWHTQLRFPKTPATGFAYTDPDVIKMLQYLRHFPAAKF